jgi:ABC-type nitrate/sulfonate/bicarbonate transport system substrate-binding protein
MQASALLAFPPALAVGTPVRITSGLRATTHGMSWLGVEAGIYRKHGIDVSFPSSVEVTGPEAVNGLLRGDWEFCHTGTVPVAESFLKGQDAVVLARNTLSHESQFIATQPGFKSLSELTGKRIGVLSDATAGQTGINTRLTIEKAGATASYVGLGTFGNIYAALGRGEIDAGVLPIHMRFAGRRKYGWNIFELTGVEVYVPSVLATTCKLIATNRDLVMRYMEAYVDTIHAFKTQPGVFVPLPQRLLGLDERVAAEDLYKFYVPLFPRVPHYALGEGIKGVRAVLKRYPAAPKLQETDFSDPSFLVEIDTSGYVGPLYGDKG